MDCKFKDRKVKGLYKKAFTGKPLLERLYWKYFNTMERLCRRAKQFNIFYIMRTHKIGNELCNSGFGKEEMDLIDKRLFP